MGETRFENEKGEGGGRKAEGGDFVAQGGGRGAKGEGRMAEGLAPSPSAQERADIPLDAIRIDPAFNVDPRRSSDPELIGAMADSISKVGLLQPLVVLVTRITDPHRPLGAAKTAVHAPVEKGGWEFFLLAGFIRYAALKKLGHKIVPVVLKRNLSELDQFAVNDTENLRRTPVHPFHRAKRFELLMNRFGLTCADIAERYGYSEVHVENLVHTYQKIDPEIRKEVFENLDVDETRIPTLAWLMTTSKKPTDEQKEAYIEKYGEGRNHARRSEADDGQAKPVEDKVRRPRRRDVEQVDKLIHMLRPGAQVEIAIQGFEDRPLLNDRERVLIRTALWFAQDAKKICPLRPAKKVVEAPVIPFAAPAAGAGAGAGTPEAQLAAEIEKMFGPKGVSK